MSDSPRGQTPDVVLAGGTAPVTVYRELPDGAAGWWISDVSARDADPVVIDITVGERHKAAATRRTHPKEARTVVVSARLTLLAWGYMVRVAPLSRTPRGLRFLLNACGELPRRLEPPTAPVGRD